LARTHRTVAVLNACYVSHYAAFAEVPIPGLAQPEFYDYSRFNEERFAAWHQWMGKVIHSLAPQALVHAKIQLEGAVLSRWYHKSSWGVDPELFGESMDLNGNDDIILEPEAGTDWALAWQLQNLGYDIQRSLAAKPIFNSENHPTLDGYTGYVQPEHFRTALWQGAIHGQGATTIWVWERTTNHADCLYGNVMDRPGCAQAVGVTRRTPRRAHWPRSAPRRCCWMPDSQPNNFSLCSAASWPGSRRFRNGGWWMPRPASPSGAWSGWRQKSRGAP
jgi:hypothetical protein